MAKRALGLIALAMLCACDGGGTTAAAPPPTPLVVANPYHDGLLALGELPRGAALRNAIRTARESCNRVEANAFQQDHGNLKMWTARCAANDYALFIAPGGEVQVRKCVDMATLKLPTCRPIAPKA